MNKPDLDQKPRAMRALRAYEATRRERRFSVASSGWRMFHGRFHKTPARWTHRIKAVKSWRSGHQALVLCWKQKKEPFHALDHH